MHAVIDCAIAQFPPDNILPLLNSPYLCIIQYVSVSIVLNVFGQLYIVLAQVLQPLLIPWKYWLNLLPCQQPVSLVPSHHPPIINFYYSSWNKVCDVSINIYIYDVWLSSKKVFTVDTTTPSFEINILLLPFTQKNCQLLNSRNETQIMSLG